MIDSDAVLITDDIKSKEGVLADGLLKPPRD